MAQKYFYPNAATLQQFFDEEFIKKLGLKPEQMENLVCKRGIRVKKMFVRSVFSVFLNELIDDIIKNDIKFLFQGKKWFYIYIRAISEVNFERILHNGKIYQDVNLIDSDFKIYEFVFQSPFLGYKKFRQIRIGYKKYKEIVKSVNEGKRYSMKKRIRTHHHLLPKLKEHFPGLTDQQIDMIVYEGLKQIHYNICVLKKELILRNSFHKLKMLFYRAESIKTKMKGNGSPQEPVPNDQH